MYEVINSNEIKNINFQNPHDMKALVCLYNSIFIIFLY